MNKKLKLSAGALLAMVAVDAHAGVIVVSRDSSLQSLPLDQARRVFLGLQPFVGGRSVTVVYQREGDIRSAFEENVVGETGASLAGHWFKQIFSGRARPLVEASNDTDVKARINATNGAIGFISDNAVDGTVRALYKY